MSVRCIVLILLLALGVMVGANVAPRTAEAQGRNSADLRVSISHEGSSQTDVTVAVSNHGLEPAYDVEVAIEAFYPADTEWFNPPDVKGVGYFTAAVSGMITDDVVVRSGVWKIDVVPAQTEYTAEFGIYKTGDMNGYRATLRSAHPVETGLRAADNVAEYWVNAYTTFTARHGQRAMPDYAVATSISPASGNAFDLEVTVQRNPNAQHDRTGTSLNQRVYDACVDIMLPPGMAVVGDGASATITGRTDPDTYYDHDGRCDSAGSGTVAGAFHVGELSGTTYDVSLRLPLVITDGTAGEPQCARAELTALPPVGPGLYGDDPHDNVAEACLGATEPEREPFEPEEVEATIFLCVGVTAAPCDGTDDVRVRAVVKDTDPKVIVTSGTTVVHVPDVPNREYDDSANSVNAGTEVSWQIPITMGLGELGADHANWSHYDDGFAASGIDGETPPGHVNVRAWEGQTFEVIYRMNPDTQWTGESNGGFSVASYFASWGYTAEFEKLGTYKIDITMKATHATQTGDCDTDGDRANDAFCATETYVFHVGPKTDLEVRDGGASLNVSSDRRAFTIQAINNGPYPSQRAEVTVRLPSGVSVAEALPSAGRYDAARNVWVLGGLREHRPQTLTLITDATAGTEINAAIVVDNTAPYTVCIDSSGANLDHDNQDACEADTTNGGDWHEGTVFDYLNSNNTATIRARTGLAGGVQGAAPAQVHAIATGPGANLVYWKEPESGSDRDELGPVRSWDIDYNDGEGEGWKPLLRNYLEYSGHRYYANHNVPEGSMRQYRVRARYDERASEWTEQTEPGTARAAATSGDPGVTIRPTALTLREGGRGSYSVRLDARPAGDVVIDLSNSNPDVRLSTSRLVFTPSNWNRPQTVYVNAVEDGDVADETDVISHVIDQAATSADYDYFILPDVTVSVTDNDAAPRITAGGSGTTQIGVDEGGSTTYQLALSARPTEDVRVSLTYPSGVIGVSPQSLVFTPENYNRPQTITVTGAQDDDAVDDDLAFICHSFSGGYAEDLCLYVTVVDDDRAGVGGEVEFALSRSHCPGTWPDELSGSEIKVTGYPEHAGGCFYSLRLNAVPTGNVTITVRTDARKVDLDADIYTDAKESRLTFTPENWRDAQEIRFEPVWDADGVHNNDFTITYSVSGGGFNGVVIPKIVVNVIDHDRKHIGFRVEGPHSGVQIAEGGSCSWNEDLYDAAFYMFPETQPMSTVTVAMSSSNADVRLSPSRLSFTRSNWDQGAYEGSPGKRVIVCAAQDADDQDEEATITFTVTSSDADYNGMELTPVPVRVVDDD